MQKLDDREITYKVQAQRVNSRRYFDIATVVFIIFVTVLLIVRWHIFPVFIDIYYHLAVMQGYNLAGGVTANAYWEFAPFGRPQLYPPLLHLLMLILYKLRLSLPFIAKFTSCIMFPLTLITEWYVVKKTFNSETAFFATVTLGSIYQFFWHTSVLSAAALAQILGLLSFLAIEKGKKLAAPVLLTLMLYSHIAIPYFYFAAFLIYGVFRKERRKIIFTSLIISFALFLPWFIHFLKNISFIHARNAFAEGFIPQMMHFYLWIWLFGIIGTVISIIRKKQFLYPLILLIMLLPIAFTYRQRFFDVHALVPLSILSGVGIANLLSAIKNLKFRLSFAVALSLIILFTSPALNIMFHSVGISWDNTLAISIMKSEGSFKMRPNFKPRRTGTKGSTFIPHKQIMTEDNIKFAEFLKRHTENSSTIYAPDGPLGDFIFAFSTRPVSSGMLSEVHPYKRPLQHDCRYLIIPGNVTGLLEPLNNGFKRAGFVYGFTIFKNKNSTKKAFPDKPVFPNWLSFLLIGISAIIFLLDFLKKIDLRRINGDT